MILSNVSVVDASTILAAAIAKGASFMTFVYAKKTDGEVARYTVNLGFSYENAMKADKVTLQAFEPSTPLQVQAKAEMMESLEKSLNGTQDKYTNKDTYNKLAGGLVEHKETKEVYFFALKVSKVQIEPPTVVKKPVVSKPLTLAKKEIEKACQFKRNAFAQFSLTPDYIATMKVRGNEISFGEVID